MKSFRGMGTRLINNIRELRLPEEEIVSPKQVPGAKGINTIDLSKSLDGPDLQDALKNAESNPYVAYMTQQKIITRIKTIAAMPCFGSSGEGANVFME
jgi:hypothetical protein